MEQLKITGKKFNKSAVEILRNIELLFFIKKNPEIYNYSFIINYTKDKNKEKY